MEKLKAFWYKLVAPSLLIEIERLEKSRAEWELQFDRQVEVVEDWATEAAKLQKLYDETNAELNSHIRVCEKTISEQGRKIKELKRSHDPYRGCIDHNARHAAQTRIRDLELQLRKRGIEPQ